MSVPRNMGIPIRMLLPKEVADNISIKDFESKYDKKPLFLTNLVGTNTDDNILFIWGRADAKMEELLNSLINYFQRLNGTLRNAYGERAVLLLLSSSIADEIQPSAWETYCKITKIGMESLDIVVSISSLGIDGLVKGILRIIEIQEKGTKSRFYRAGNLYQCISDKNIQDVLAGKYGIITIGKSEEVPTPEAKQTCDTIIDNSINKSLSDKLGWDLLRHSDGKVPIQAVLDNTILTVKIIFQAPPIQAPSVIVLKAITEDAEKQTQIKCCVSTHNETDETITFEITGSPLNNSIAILMVQHSMSYYMDK